MRHRTAVAAIAIFLAGSVLVTTDGAPADRLYGVSWTGDFYELRGLHGSATLIGPTGFDDCNAMATDSQSRILVARGFDSVENDDQIILVDPETGAGSVLVDLVGMPERTSVRGLAMDSNDRMYAVISANESTPPDLLATIDLESGTVTPIGSTELDRIQGLAFDASDTLYFIDLDDDGRIGTIDVQTGEVTLIGGSGLVDSTQALDFDSAGRMYAARYVLVEVDPATGDGTYRGAPEEDIRGIGFIDTCPADLDDSRAVDTADIIAVCKAWGNEGGPEDLDDSGVVDFGDFVVVLSEWGPCP